MEFSLALIIKLVDEQIMRIISTLSSNRAVWLFILLLPLLYTACDKKEELPGPVPKIHLISGGPERIQAYNDSVWFQIGYEDGDGDLGTNDPAQKNLFLEDARLGLLYSFRIRDLVPGNSAVPIKGELHFSIPNTIMKDNVAEEKVIYRIWITDNAGNQSNVVSPGEWVVFQ